MKLVPRDPFFNYFSQLKDLNQLFNIETNDEDSTIATSNWAPPVDIVENEHSFLIDADIPGVEPKEIEVSMEDGMLTIKGERKSEAKEEKEGYTRIERSYGSFYRRFSMPESADPENITAKSTRGVLQIKVGKKEVAKPKRISVKVQ